MNGGGLCFGTNCDFGGGPNGLLVSEGGVEEPDFEGTGGGGGEGFDNQRWEAESWFMVFVGGVPTIEDTGSESVAAKVVGVGSSKSSKPHDESAVSLTGDTTNELEPLDVWRIGCWLVEGVIEPSAPSGFISFVGEVGRR